MIGACLLSVQAVETAAKMLLVSDFGSPNLAAAFGATESLYRRGLAIDAMTVADELRTQGASWPTMGADLIALQSNTPSTASVGRYAEIVARFSARRLLHVIGTELLAGSGDLTRDPADLADAVRSRMLELDNPTFAGDPGDVSFEMLLAESNEIQPPPIIPGLLNEDDRVVIVGLEGQGKSELFRQMASCLAFGVHPFTFRPIPALPTLLADFENPRAIVRSRLRYITGRAQIAAQGERAPARLWHRPGGIDLRRRPDRVAFEDVLRRCKPKLVAIGPLYKTYSQKASESDERVAAEMQAILDDLRTRYAFALLLEHHAPQASNGVRELRPYGSSLWLRWPEFGISLKPHSGIEGALELGRWRGDRSPALWPDELHRGDVWPWVGYYRNGLPQDAASSRHPSVAR